MTLCFRGRFRLPETISLTPITRFVSAGLVAGALAASSVAVPAQAQGPYGAQQQPDLSSILHLRPDQQGAYRAYQAGSQPHPDEMAQMRATSSQALAGMPTPQRLDRIGSVLNLQVQIFQRRAAATRAFYGQLSPDQQHAFDQATAPPAQRNRPQG